MTEKRTGAQKPKFNSLLDAYIEAAWVAAVLRISLQTAFNNYVKPEMPSDLPNLTSEQLELAFPPLNKAEVK